MLPCCTGEKTIIIVGSLADIGNIPHFLGKELDHGGQEAAYYSRRAFGDEGAVAESALYGRGYCGAVGEAETVAFPDHQNAAPQPGGEGAGGL
ncbi:hypothetical protein D3C81_1935530 [compost metagenome]